MKKFLAGLVSLLMLSTAFAEPTITHLGYTAYLGSSNELYLQDPTGTVRVLRYPIADILSITDTVVYCRAQDGKLLSIALDGSQSLIIAETPTDEQVNALTAKSNYTLTDGVLRNGATIVDTGVLAFCDLADEQTTTAPDELLYLKQNEHRCPDGAHGERRDCADAGDSGHHRACAEHDGERREHHHRRI